MADTRDVLARLSAALADRYTILRELGAGGMATVCLANDIKHDRDVAIKVLRPNIPEAISKDRFIRDIAITARLEAFVRRRPRGLTCISERIYFCP